MARRELWSDRARLAVGLLAIAAAVALVIVLMGLRRGMAEQVTIYVDRQGPVFVARSGTRNFLGADSVVSAAAAARVRSTPGVARVTPVSEQYAMLGVGERRVLSVLIGYDPAGRGGPWLLSSGKEPSAAGDMVVDEVLAGEHGLSIGSRLDYRGTTFTITGLSRGTSGWMLPLVFTTRESVNQLSGLRDSSTFLIIEPLPGVSEESVSRRVARAAPDLTALSRRQVAANDRALFSDTFNGTLLAMVAIAFVVAVIVIGLTVYGSTVERSREHATLRALGLPARSLLRLVAVQAVVLAVAGSCAGALLGLLAARLVNVWAPKYLIVVSGRDVVLVAAAALVLALAGALAPARHVARIAPDSALRG